MKKFLRFDWLRAVQFLGNTVPKRKLSGKKGNSAQISLESKFLNYLTIDVIIFIASVCFSDFSVCYNYVYAVNTL